MSEREQKVETFVVDYICDECSTGTPMRCLDMMLTSMPPKWVHVCDRCGVQKTFDKQYPQTVMKRIPS